MGRQRVIIDDDLKFILMEIVQDLPAENIRQVLDYADYLRSKSKRDNILPRGSAQALLSALEQVGPLAFRPGELEARLTEIQAMREMGRQDDAVIELKVTQREMKRKL